MNQKLSALFIINWLFSVGSFAQSSKTRLTFPNAFVYEVVKGNEKSEVWIYHNPKTGQFLYVPNDDMVKSVVGSANGIYTIYAQNENGKKVKFVQTVSKISEQSPKNNLLKRINKTKTITGSQGKIVSEGFTLSYLKTNEIDTLYLSTQIKGNANILYGFSRLEGDAKLPNAFDLIGQVSNNQFLIEYISTYSTVKLVAYESNPYTFETRAYQLKK